MGVSLFIAGLLFPTVLATAANPSTAMAFNLFGAVIGGLLEYVSNFTGVKSLELIALLLYFVSFLCVNPGNKGQKPELAASSQASS